MLVYSSRKEIHIQYTTHDSDLQAQKGLLYCLPTLLMTLYYFFLLGGGGGLGGGIWGFCDMREILRMGEGGGGGGRLREVSEVGPSDTEAVTLFIT
jgi:hypothetical protein